MGTLATRSHALSIDNEARAATVTLGTAQVIGIHLTLAKVGTTDNDAGKAELEDTVLHLGIGKRALGAFRKPYPIPVLGGGRTHGEEIPKGVGTIEGRGGDIARERYRVLVAVHAIGARTGCHKEHQQGYEIAFLHLSE